MESSDALQKAQKLVSGLLGLKENFIHLKGEDNLACKNEIIEKELKLVLVELNKLQLLIDNKAEFFCLRGKALNVLPHYDVRSIECLSKAVKLNPTLVDAWNELGESYWKDRQILQAHNCFQEALAKQRNKVSLRNLSMVQRQLGKDFRTKAERIKVSVETAKASVAFDFNDGRSWFVLGNAYLSLFFHAGQSPASLKQCMIAFKRAESDNLQTNNPDLYYNRAVAYKYQELYEEALQDYLKASFLDPSWNEPRENAAALVKRLKTTEQMIKTLGGKKPKKINTMVGQMKPTDYGVYGTGEYISPLNKSIKICKATLSELMPLRNDNMVVAGKVVAIIPVKDGVPYCFIMMDSERNGIAVSVFNLAVNRPVLVGDSLAVPEPYVQNNIIHTDDNQVVSFRSIRVENPVVMVINRKKVGPDRLAFSVLNVTNETGSP